MLTALLLCLSCVGALGLNVPKYLTPCSRNDLQCLQRSAQSTLKAVLPGDRKFRVPPLNPLIIPLVEILGPAVNLTFKDLKVEGLENSTIQSLKINHTKRITEVKYYIPRVYLLGEYSMKGKLLFLYLDGADMANITAEECYVTWTYQYDLQDKKGQEYMKILHYETQYKVGNAVIQFHKIFGDSELLSRNTNEILTSEWPSVFKELDLGITTTIGMVFNMVTTAFFDRIPFNKLSLP